MSRSAQRKGRRSAAKTAGAITNPIAWPNGANCALAITFDVDTDVSGGALCGMSFRSSAARRGSTCTRSWLPMCVRR